MPTKFLVGKFLSLVVAAGCAVAAFPAHANLPGGGTGTGPDVTLVDNGDGTVTMANGIVSIVITKADATIHQIYYTYDNGAGTTTNQLLAGGYSGGKFYWELGGFGSSSFAYSVVADPASTGGNYAEVSLLNSSVSSGTVEIHFSMLRGSTGFYVTPIWSHRSVDGAMSMGLTRDNIYAGSIFNWMSVDAARNRLMEVTPGETSLGVFNAPKEVTQWTSGIYQGRYEDKYCYSADFGLQRAWGWSSVGAGGMNVGLWNISASVEYYDGGPMKRELMEHIGTTILNVLNGSHYGGGKDSGFAAGEIWTKVYGPYFIYCNNISGAIIDPTLASDALYADALAQAAAEESAWPYRWFTNADYAPASDRGTVTGRIAIDDTENPNASAAGLWVGVVQQPSTTAGIYDFQDWMKPYQFWVKTDSNGDFTIPHVIAGSYYTLYAFGPGAAGTFMSQAQTGGSPPNSVDIPTNAVGVTVFGSATNNLGVVTWTPTRVGPTVFQIGYPNRTGDKFRHGDDYWVGDIGPDPNNPSPIWSKHLEYPFDFPSGPDYVVGQSRWTTDWNYVQPIVTDSAGNFNGSISTITFTLPSAPAGGAQASFYIALSSDFQGPLIIQVNGNNIAGSTGYFPAYSNSGSQSDTTIRQAIHGCFSDNRLDFPASYLHQGQNSITINMRKGGSFANHAMYDYIRLELAGYVPPPPPNATAYAGSNSVLVCWPVTPGATSYNILRSTNSGTGYLPLTNGILGPICGSGPVNATYLDTTAVNGVTYYYEVQSANPVGSSGDSSQSAGVTPSSDAPTTAPDAPTGLNVSGVGHHTVNLAWSPSPGADFYTVRRSTIVDNGAGTYVTLGSITLDNTVTGTTYTDTTPTDGSTYRYSVSATSAGGTSGDSLPVVAVPLPTPPASTPGSLTGHFVASDIVLNWSAVPGAVGYIIRRSTSSAGPYTYVMSITETTYTDAGLDPATTYYYQVTAVNAAGVSPAATVSVTAPPTAPVSLSAVPGDAQVTLSWSAVPSATGYVLYRGTNSGNETITVVSDYPGTSYTNTGLMNGTTYYYVVAATNSTGLGPVSPEAAATPDANIVVTPRSLIWLGDGAANIWDVSGAANWQTNNVATVFHDGDTVTFDNTGANNVPVALAGTPMPALVTFNASKNYTLNGPGSIAGTNQLIQVGSGQLTLNATNFYSGGTIISNSSIAIGNIGANSAAWGSGPILLLNGTVQFNGYGGSTSTGWGGCSNTIDVPAGWTGTLLLPPRWGYSVPFTSPLGGGGTLNVTVDFIRDYFSGDWSGFTGRINVSPRSGGGDFRIDNTAGYANAAITLNDGIDLYAINHNSLTIDIGELDGATTAVIGAGNNSAANPAYRIGARNTTSTYAGVISDSGVTSLTKVGTGTLILSGTNSSYSGPTTVSGGTLVVDNTAGSATGSGAVTVDSGATLAGDGIISGPVTIASNGTLAPGNPLGALTVNNTLTLAAGSMTLVALQHSPLTNASVHVAGALIENGTLVVTNIGATEFTAGDSFRVFDAAGFSGAFAGFVLPLLVSGLAWSTHSLATSGILSVVQLTPPTIDAVNLAGGNLVISGSGGPVNLAYYVLTSTNLSLPTAQWTRLATNYFDATGHFAFTNELNATQPELFFRLQLP